EHRYLLFRLGAELYGTPLLEVREIIEWQACKSIPHVSNYFLGVINLRGQITGVIDLRRRFGIHEENNDTQVLMVFAT
ncbi:chemotaxis protein CheW, partial [Klebsiella pneumoniae]